MLLGFGHRRAGSVGRFDLGGMGTATGEQFAGEGEEMSTAGPDPEAMPEEAALTPGIREVLGEVENVIVAGQIRDRGEGGEVLAEESIAPGPEDAGQETGTGIEALEEEALFEFLRVPAVLLVSDLLEVGHESVAMSALGSLRETMAPNQAPAARKRSIEDTQNT